MWLSLIALRYERTSSRCVAVAEALEPVSHDGLTRMLPADWAGQRLLESACRMLCVWEQGGRILDDTVIPKPLATAMESWAWVYSRQDRQPVDGCSLVPWVWTTGTLRLPLGLRLWRQGGPAPYALA